MNNIRYVREVCPTEIVNLRIFTLEGVCPHCNFRIDMHKSLKYCRFCGKRIYWAGP